MMEFTQKQKLEWDGDEKDSLIWIAVLGFP